MLIAGVRRQLAHVVRGNAMYRLALACLVLFLFAGVAQAAEDPTGTWKWSTTFGDQTRESTLKLKLEKDKLTGAFVRDNQETPIENATYKDGQVAFSVTRERNNQKFTIKYSGRARG